MWEEAGAMAFSVLAGVDEGRGGGTEVGRGTGRGQERPAAVKRAMVACWNARTSGVRLSTPFWILSRYFWRC